MVTGKKPYSEVKERARDVTVANGYIMQSQRPGNMQLERGVNH